MNHLSQFFSRINKLSLFCLFFCFSMAGISYGATYYMPDDFPNLQAAFENISSGDTLIIRDGEYVGSENVIDSWHYPPNGSVSSYTTIRAEHAGEVVFDGQNSRWMFYKDGSTSGVMQYITFEGLIWKNSTQQNVFITSINHIKFKKCGFVDAATDSDSFATHTCNNILVENCWSCGNARYHFHYYNTANSIFRRCVARHDRGHAGYQVGFQTYHSDNIAIQNCIVLDSDQTSHYNNASELVAFINPNNSVTGDSNNYVGCIGLNNRMTFAYVGAKYTNISFENSLSWDNYSDGGTAAGASNVYARGPVTIDHSTFGNTVRNNTYGIGGDGDISVNNSMIYHIGGDALWSFGGAHPHSYLSLYDNESYGVFSPSSGDITNVDPIDGSPGNGTTALKYLLKIEEGSDLDDAASDSGAIGATILYKYGRDGTLWGEPGYDEITDEPLWPFPYEDIIRARMRVYNQDGINGARGFCADGQTLTKYIWEYLGNPIPPEIYGGEPPEPDSTPPVISNVGTSNITTTSATITWTTNESATSRVDYGETTGYGQQQTQTALTTSHQVALSGLQPNTTYHYKVTSSDSSSNSAESADFTFTTEEYIAPDTTAPVISNVGANNITTTTATISWTTDEQATSQVVYGETIGYGQQESQTSLITSHQVTLAGLQPDTTYHYMVSSSDSSGNSAESSDFTFTTTQDAGGEVTFSSLQSFEDGSLWVPGGGQDPTGNGRGWAFLDAGSSADIAIDSSIGANNTSKSLKITFDSNNPQIYFRSNDKITDHMPEAAGANRMSFYVRFPAGFPIQPLPFRYDTWQLGTYIHDPADWSDTHQATFEADHGIHHYYHRLTVEQAGDGWVKYIVTTQPDQANYSGSTVPPDISHYFDNFGRFYFHFGPEAGGPAVPRPFTIWIDEIKFYHDDGTVGGQIHVGGQDDAGFDGEFFPDSSGGGGNPLPDTTPPAPPTGLGVH